MPFATGAGESEEEEQEEDVEVELSLVSGFCRALPFEADGTGRVAEDDDELPLVAGLSRAFPFEADEAGRDAGADEDDGRLDSTLPFVAGLAADADRGSGFGGGAGRLRVGPAVDALAGRDVLVLGSSAPHATVSAALSPDARRDLLLCAGMARFRAVRVSSSESELISMTSSGTC